MKYKSLFQVAGMLALNTSIISPIFSRREDPKLSEDIKSEGEALNSNPHYRNGNALEQFTFAAQYKNYRSESLRNKNCFYPYLSTEDQKKLNMEFDKEYEKKMDQIYSSKKSKP